jgi:protease IV
MISEAELMVDRRRLKRRVTFWRIAAIVLLVAAIGAAFWSSGDLAHYENHIARVRIDGLITGDQASLDLLDEIAESKRVKAVILRIDSPGGTTSGAEALYEAIRKIARDKPVVAVMDTVAASGGYIAAIAADHIVARGNTITGSIGVIFTFPEFSRLLDTLGIKMEEIKSGELKAEPSPYKPVTEKVRLAANELVQDSFAWFTGLVSERRHLPLDQVRLLADGRVFSGRQAAAVKLIDVVGNEDSAVAWLESERKIAKDTEIVDWKVPFSADPTSFGFALSNGMLRALGLDSARLPKLDGLLVLWHPQL